MSNTNELGNKLWDMANNLRGTMDASEYKNYILPFMFYKYLSNNQEKYIKENFLEDFYTTTDEEEIISLLQDISIGLGYVIEPKYMWDKIISDIDEAKFIASDFQQMIESFNLNLIKYENNHNENIEEKNFKNVFDDVRLGDSRLGETTAEKANALIKVVKKIDELKYVDETGKDILGDVYEYMIGKFAANAGKKGGEFYTPHSVSVILSKMVTANAKNNSKQFRVYDPTCGSGSLLLTVRQELPFVNKERSVNFYGQELNKTTFNIARMNLMMHNVHYRNMKLRCADTLDSDWPFSKENGINIPLKFDAIVANPPYSQSWDTKDVDREKDIRFKEYGVAPASKADYAFILHGLYHLDSKGTMAIVLPHGVLFRGASEGKIRKNLIKNNMLDAVIGLPSNLFYGTSIPTCILVFKGAEIRKTKDILFIDASKEFVKDKNQNILTKEHIDKIFDTYNERKEIDKYSHNATIDEIEENDYNLNIPRYVDTFEEEEEIDIKEVLKNIKELETQRDELDVEINKYLKELGLLGDDE
ncbi:MAG: type I restriction-modification system subunit M [bacterium]